MWKGNGKCGGRVEGLCVAVEEDRASRGLRKIELAVFEEDG